MATPISPTSQPPFALPSLKTSDLPALPDVKVQAETPTDELRRVTLTDDALPEGLQEPLKVAEQKGKGKDKKQLKIPGLKKPTSDGNMRRSFSFRRSKSTSKVPKTEKIEPMPTHERGNSLTVGEKKTEKSLSPPRTAPGLQRSRSKREKFAQAIANPDAMFTRDPQSPPPESKFNIDPNSRFARTFFGAGVDFGSGVPQGPLTPPMPLPDLDAPLFSDGLISHKIATELPHGYSIRPLCRSDYYRGYMDVLRVLGRTSWVSEEMWEERCAWLEKMGSTYFILVITAQNDDGHGEKVIATGTIFFERKFLHNMGIVGHVEDIAIARDQKGKKMGLRVLDALVFAAQSKGCYKIVVNCSEGNEAFHAQSGFSKEGTQMVLHPATKKQEAASAEP